MREDIASPDDLDALDRAARELKAGWGAGEDAAALDARIDRLGEAIEKVQPPSASPRLRENIEILAVALAVAMGFRTFFIQPFKIPTGSMQPTLYGITVQPQTAPAWYDRFPIKVVPWLVFGERFMQIRAQADGVVDTRVEQTDESFVYFIGGVPHVIPRDMPTFIRSGETRVRKGDVIASGRLRYGDHIFVNKMRYYFGRPERGDIFVFSTDDIRYPRIRPNSFYIKRLAGMPGESIQIDPPYLVANGRRITEPYPFKRLLEDAEHGYKGYHLPPGGMFVQTAIRTPASVLRLGPEEYLPLGDNTDASLDGRYFGGVPRKNIVGPAFAIYWPASPRWGSVR